MMIGVGIALLALGAAIGVLWSRLGAKRVASTGRGAAAGAAADAAVAAAAPTDEGSGSHGDALRSERRASTAALWRYALGVRGQAAPLTAEHVAVSRAALAALQAGKLPDRYFPRRPLLMPQLQAAVNSTEASSTRLAEIIGQDPVLAGSILKLANSVFYRLSARPVESIQRAVVVCGTDGLQSLAVTALMQPVFSGGSDAHTQFPAVLWERCTRASLAAELLARRWCPADRQIAQLLALVAALGPLVVYRVVQDQYRSAPGLQPEPALFLSFIEQYADGMARHVAELWQSSPRMIAALDAAYAPEQDTSAVSPPVAPLAQSLLAGELLAALSLLRQRQLHTDEQCQQLAAEAGVPADLFTPIWERLLRSD